MIGPGVSVVLHRLVRHRYPPVDQPPPFAEQLIEGRAELSAHGTVENEVDGRVYKRQDIYYVTCQQIKQKQKLD